METEQLMALLSDSPKNQIHMHMMQFIYTYFNNHIYLQQVKQKILLYNYYTFCSLV